MECDEYPPAVLNDGTYGQTRMCIEGYQNSGTQGPMLSRLVSQCGLAKDDQVKVRIEGGCKGFNFSKKKREDHLQEFQRREEIVMSGSNATLRDPMGDGSLTYVALTMEELDDGHYDMTVSFDGAVHNVTVMDKYGEVYAVLVPLPLFPSVVWLRC
jgi:hypothetical protein